MPILCNGTGKTFQISITDRRFSGPSRLALSERKALRRVGPIRGEYAAESVYFAEIFEIFQRFSMETA